MLDGNLSLMQMGKIDCALYMAINQIKRFYASILSSHTTGGVTANFAMLGMSLLPKRAIIDFVAKIVIKQTSNIEVPEGVQETEYVFEKGASNVAVREMSKRLNMY